ncbi:MAG: hypothetical protein IPP32_02725 [Bacteroidetes bacterium]|nr:hypothetical protein [Bacteroidota bacterium]
MDTMSILIIVGISLGAGLISYLLIHGLKKRDYDNKKHQAVLEEVRGSFEKQMYALNDRLIQSEERWRDVNHLLLRKEYLENQSPILVSKRTQYSDFLRANGVTENDLIVEPRSIFILTPFHDKYYEDYKVIRETCIDLGYKCSRGDDTYFDKADIFPQMLKLIVKSTLIIANLNGRNPNVLYELGIAQALDKTIILIASEPEKLELPVDIKSKRFLIYKSYKDLQEKIRTELKGLSSN